MKVKKYITYGVNALNGATLISTTGKSLMVSTVKVCQCPEWGDPHFYDVADLRKVMIGSVCQCPEWGDPHFYLTMACCVK